MARLAVVAALLLVTFALPSVSASTPSCADATVTPLETIPFAGQRYYIAPQTDGRVAFQESNGLVGLQTVPCLDGSILRAADRSPPDVPPVPPVPDYVWIGLLGYQVCLF